MVVATRADEELMGSIRSEMKGRREECLLCDEE